MKTHMSASQYAKWAECEFMALAYCKGEYVQETTDAMIAGSLFDAHLCDTVDEFRERNPQAYKKDGTLYAKYNVIDEMLAKAKGDKVFQAAIEGDKQVVIRRELFGVEWVAYIDVLNIEKGFFTDIKTTKSMALSWSEAHHAKIPFHEVWNYWRQLAIYQMLISLEHGKSLQPHLAVITKETPPDIGVFVADNEWRLTFELMEIEGRMSRITDIKAGDADPEKCGKCEWCIINKVATVESLESII